MALPDDRAPAALAARCAPCRGSGEVICTLGGSGAAVTCPWCEGSGTQIRGHDAQVAAAAARAGAT